MLSLSATTAFPQSQATTGTIEGTVTDQTGAAIAGASLTVLNIDTNYQRKMTTDESGRFRFVLLPLGGYKLTATTTRFGTLVREGFDLAVGQTINLNLTLSVANITETVSVEADAPVVETGAVERAAYIDKNSIRTLPNNGRNFYDFMNLTSGVTIVQGPDGNEISVNDKRHR